MASALKDGVVCSSLFGIIPLGARNDKVKTDADIIRADDSHLYTLLHTLSMLQRSDTDEGYTIIRTPVPYHKKMKDFDLPEGIDLDDGIEDPDLAAELEHFKLSLLFSPGVSVTNVRVMRYVDYERIYEAVPIESPFAPTQHNITFKSLKPTIGRGENLKVSRSLPIPQYSLNEFPTFATMAGSSQLQQTKIRDYLEKIRPFTFPIHLANQSWHPAIWDPTQSYAAYASKAHEWYKASVRDNYENLYPSTKDYLEKSPFPTSFPAPTTSSVSTLTPSPNFKNSMALSYPIDIDRTANSQENLQQSQGQKQEPQDHQDHQDMNAPKQGFGIHFRASDVYNQQVEAPIPTGTPWVLQHVLRPKQPVEGNQSSARMIHQSVVGENYENFLRFLGYTLKFESLQQGFLFKIDEATEIRVYQIYTIPNTRHVRSAMKVSPGSRWICEIRTISTPQTEKIVEERIYKLAALLAPIDFVNANLYRVLTDVKK